MNDITVLRYTIRAVTRSRVDDSAETAIFHRLDDIRKFYTASSTLLLPKCCVSGNLPHPRNNYGNRGERKDSQYIVNPWFSC